MVQNTLVYKNKNPIVTMTTTIITTFVTPKALAGERVQF